NRPRRHADALSQCRGRRPRRRRPLVASRSAGGFPKRSRALSGTLIRSVWAAERVMPGAPKRLRCEYLETPIGIDEPRPRLSWWIDDDRPAEIQTEYQIIAARRPESLDEDNGDLWDSGRVESSSTCHIPYAGKPLTSRQRVWWKVRTFDSDGIGSAWSRA